jgi:hypothetical protein
LVRHFTGNRHLVLVQRGDRLRGEQQDRMSADDDRDFQRLPRLFRDAIVGQRVAWKQQDADAVRTANLATVDRDVLDAGLGIAGDQQSGRDIGPAVALIVFWNRKLAEQIDVHMDDVLHRPARHLVGRQWLPRGSQKSR